MPEPFHIVHSIWCERANERIAELEAEVEKLRWMLRWGYQHEITERTYDEWSAYLERRWEERR